MGIAKQVRPRGRNALTEGDPGMMPWDRKDKLPGFEGRLGGWDARVNWVGVLVELREGCCGGNVGSEPIGSDAAHCTNVRLHETFPQTFNNHIDFERGF